MVCIFVVFVLVFGYGIEFMGCLIICKVIGIGLFGWVVMGIKIDKIENIVYLLLCFFWVDVEWWLIRVGVGWFIMVLWFVEKFLFFFFWDLGNG